MALIQRLITVTFTLAQGTFAESGQNQVTLEGLRVSAKVVKAGGRSLSTANVNIYGMTLSIMNQLSTLGLRVSQLPRNIITVQAGDAVNGMATVFIGTIYNAFADFAGAPDVAFRVEAHTLGFEALSVNPSSSFPGRVPVTTIMSSIATAMGIAFENNGVTAVLTDTYLSGSLRQQAQLVVDAANIKWNGGDNGVLAIWNKNGFRNGLIPLIAAPPDGEMVGYPTYTAQGVTVKTVFSPAVSGGLGTQVKVQSVLTPACGVWTIFTVDYDLESLMPSGQWFATLGCYNPQFPPPVTQ